MVGSVLTDKGFFIAVGFGLACLTISMHLTDMEM